MQPLLASQGLTTLLMLVGLVVVFYFLLIRPMRKQAAAHAEKQQQLRDSLSPGVRVQLAGGLFGSIRHLGEKQAIVELAPGTEITVVKDAITKIVDAGEEEFEYEDETLSSVEPVEQVEPIEQVEPVEQVEPITPIEAPVNEAPNGDSHKQA